MTPGLKFWPSRPLMGVLALLLCIPLVGARPYAVSTHASPDDEGMWLPYLISQNYEAMQRLGLKLTPEQIYSATQSSLKDALVQMGRGFCTASFVSGQGLIFTNHHCAYGSIQSLSTVQSDYLTNGFWAMSREQELPVPGLTIRILQRMEPVNDQLAGDLTKIQALEAQFSEGGKYTAEIRPLFNGLEYWVWVYKEYKDVRLVGAPPSSLGKFGGDTDNWEWPRHTADFAVLRVYAGADNEPAAYAATNQPYTPKRHLSVSLAGIQPGDYAMVMGFPGRTQRYLTSGQVALVQATNDIGITARGARTSTMKRQMDRSDEVRIRYAATYSSLMNYYKYFQGQNGGLQRLHTLDSLRALEDRMDRWINADSARYARYGAPQLDVAPTSNRSTVIDQMNKLAASYQNALEESTWMNEALWAPEFLRRGNQYLALYEALKDTTAAGQEKAKTLARALRERLPDLYQGQAAQPPVEQVIPSKRIPGRMPPGANERRLESPDQIITRETYFAAIEALDGNGEVGFLPYHFDTTGWLESGAASGRNAEAEYGKLSLMVDYLSSSKDPFGEADDGFLEEYSPAEQAAELERAQLAIKQNFSTMLDQVFRGYEKRLTFNEVDKTNKKVARYEYVPMNPSLLASASSAASVLDKPSREAFDRDLGWKWFLALRAYTTEGWVPRALKKYQEEMAPLRTQFMQLLKEWQASKQFYPDANSTLRLSYGSVRGYDARDGVHYNHITTLSGVMQKYQPGDEEFDVPQRLLELWRAKDYGPYGITTPEGPELITCFLTDNDITGGNSGSPVMNGRGELIGLAFDGNWEAMTGDLVYDGALKRCINVDIRYVLFIVDKYAGAGHLVKELTLAGSTPAGGTTPPKGAKGKKPKGTPAGS